MNEAAHRDFDFRPSIETIDGALVLPASSVAGRRVTTTATTHDGGVYGADGRLCETSRHWSAHAVHAPAATSRAPARAHLPGTHLFGGFVRPHFGHFLVEGLARLWAASQLPDADGRILFVPLNRAGRETPGVPGYVRDLVRLLGIDRDIAFVDAPTTVERLLVPSQLCADALDERIGGDPLFRAFVARLRDLPVDPEHAADRIYVSRSRLPLVRRGGLLLERLVERCLAAQGYVVVHPQTLPIEAQISHYRAASKVILTEGSAIHLLALVARPGQKIGILRRRPSGTDKFTLQIRAYAGEDPVSFHLPTRHDVHLIDGDGPSRRLVAPDLAALGPALADAGFLDDAGLWQSPSAEEVEAALRAELAPLNSPRRRPLIDGEPVPSAAAAPGAAQDDADDGAVDGRPAATRRRPSPRRRQAKPPDAEAKAAKTRWRWLRRLARRLGFGRPRPPA